MMMVMDNRKNDRTTSPGDNDEELTHTSVQSILLTADILLLQSGLIADLDKTNASLGGASSLVCGR